MEEILVQFDKDGKPIRFVEFNENLNFSESVMLCALYTHDEDIHQKRVGNNNYQTARFAGQLIRELGFTIPHPEFYPDEYSKFEENWKEFTEFAKNHKRIMELQDRQALLLQERIDHLMGADNPFHLEEWSMLLDGNIEDLRKLGVYPT